LPVFTIHGNHDDPAGVVWVIFTFAIVCYTRK
jgi:DNA repair exonuclease SbcCD nuclease subunit